MSISEQDSKDMTGVSATFHGRASSTVIVGIPCYNEEVAIGSLVLRASQYADQVVVVDDGSTDKTAEVARFAGALVIVHDVNVGKGAAIRDLFDTRRKPVSILSSLSMATVSTTLMRYQSWLGRSCAMRPTSSTEAVT